MAPRNSQEVDCERAERMVSLPAMMEHRAASQEPGGQDSSHSSVQKPSMWRTVALRLIFSPKNLQSLR